MTEIKVIGVVGGGQMGSGIAQLAAAYGHDVWLIDSDPAALTKATNSISSSIQRLVSRNLLSREVGVSALQRLKCSTDLKELHSADVIIEAIVESEDVKRKLFLELDKIAKPSAILASNTSSIPITRLASSTTRPDKVIGMHFMNPPPIMKLVEIVRGADTSDETFHAIKTLAERLGKTLICSQDYSGFIVNRILMPMINEAFFALYTGVATKEDIDTGMKLGTNHPMGPLELADLIGLDVCVSIMKLDQILTPNLTLFAHACSCLITMAVSPNLFRFGLFRYPHCVGFEAVWILVHLGFDSEFEAILNNGFIEIHQDIDGG